MKKELEKGKVGSSFDDFLKEQCTAEETTERAVKRVLAYQFEVAMKESGLTKVEMAKQLKTSRFQLDRLLDPENDKVTLAALSQAAKAVSRTLRLELQELLPPVTASQLFEPRWIEGRVHDGALDFPMSEVGSDEAGKSALVDKGSTAALDSTVSRKRGDEPVGLSRGGVG